MQKIFKSLFIFFNISSFLFFASCDHHNDPVILDHIVVHKEEGYFMGWPANNGIWKWEDGEIMVGFTRGPFITKDGHDVNPPYQSWLAKSQDGGYTWKAFNPDGFVSPFDPNGLNGDSILIMKELRKPIDLKNRNLALRVIGNGYLQPDVSEGGFYYSYDRGESWEGPYAFKGLPQDIELKGIESFTPRTDYIIENRNSALFFLSVRISGGDSSDKTFVARTTDGGLTFEFIDWIVNPKDPFRAVMPSTVKTSSGKLISAIRRREVKRRDLYPHCWIDIYTSHDNGETWKFLSRAAETGQSNGNPPALIQLSDGRLLLVYGNREHIQIRARFSSNEGRLWGPEIILREGKEQDLGYPRLVQNNDGNIVTIYYWAETTTSEKYIEATIWNPGSADKLGSLIHLAPK